MSKSNNVEIVSYFSIDKTPYKYAHKEVLTCVSVLFYKGVAKSTVYYVVGASMDFKEEAAAVVKDAFNWVYGSLKSSKFELRQSFIFDVPNEIQENLKQAIKNYTLTNGIKKTYSLSYVLREVESKDQFSGVRDIFGFETILSIAIGFNSMGFYNLTLKDQTIIRLSQIGFLS